MGPGLKVANHCGSCRILLAYKEALKQSWNHLMNVLSFFPFKIEFGFVTDISPIPLSLYIDIYIEILFVIKLSQRIKISSLNMKVLGLLSFLLHGKRFSGTQGSIRVSGEIPVRRPGGPGREVPSPGWIFKADEISRASSRGLINILRRPKIP